MDQGGVPLIISISFKAGELPGAPISKTNGHLIVVRGFAENGDVLVNDPAGRDNGSVQFTYPRAALEAAWTHSHRTTYIIHPPDWGKTHALPPRCRPPRPAVPPLPSAHNNPEPRRRLEVSSPAFLIWKKESLGRRLRNLSITVKSP